MIATTTANLNLRTGAGTGFRVITTLPTGTAVTVTGDPWYPVNVAGKAGWVSGKYLDLDAPESALTPAQQRFQAIAHTYFGAPYMWGGATGQRPRAMERQPERSYSTAPATRGGSWATWGS